MIRKLQDIAPAFARAWLRLYTSGMPADLRDARHADVNTDLWEHQQDAQGDGASPVAIAAEVLLRTLVGVPDDLGWRREAASARRGVANQGRIGTIMVSMGQIRWMGFCAVLSVAIWMGLSLVLTIFEEIGRVYTSETGWHYGGVAGNMILFVMAILLLCLMLAAVGLYTQQRAHIRKVGSIVFTILLAGISSLLIADALIVLSAYLFSNLDDSINSIGVPVGLWWFIFFAAGTYLLTPVGLLLFGIGLPSPSRRVAFVLLGWLAAVQVIWWNGLTLGAALGIVNIVLPGMCFGLLGYSLLSRSRTASRLETNP